MTYQQRVEILKELPRGAKVTVMPRVRLGDMGTDGIKLEDCSRGMIVQFKGNKTYIGYRRLTCEKIKMVEEVTERLLDQPKPLIRKYPYSLREAFEAKLNR